MKTLASPIRAWAVLTPKDFEDSNEFRPYGNGSQAQYPIFPTRKEAKAWRAESPYDRGQIVRVKVQMEDE